MSSFLPHFLSSQHTLCEEPTPPQPEKVGRYLYSRRSAPWWPRGCWPARCPPRAPAPCDPGRGPAGTGCSPPGTGRPATPGGERDQEQRWPAAPERPFRAVGSGRDLPTCLPTSSRGVAMVCSGRDGNRERKGHRENGDGQRQTGCGGGSRNTGQATVRRGRVSVALIQIPASLCPQPRGSGHRRTWPNLIKHTYPTLHFFMFSNRMLRS